jgi:hypothetical protein
MRIISLLGLLLVFAMLGCIAIPTTANITSTNGTNPIIGLLSGHERSFIYETGSKASPAMEKTIADQADSPNDARIIYGTVNLTIDDCLGLQDDYYKSLCLNSAAIYLDDPSICDEENQNYALTCYYKIAIKRSDPSFCERISASSYRDACKREIAIQTGNASLCVYDQTEQGGAKKADLCNSIAASGTLVGKADCKEDIVASVLVDATYFGDTMLWLEKNHPGEKVLSWWDYGSSLDCVGMHSVISSKDRNDPVIMQVADLLVSGNETRLAGFMRARGVKYVMLDSELLSSGDSLGGKFGALNYLSCVYENKTSASDNPGDSRCESDNLWETIFISDKPCDVSADQNGLIAYKMYYDRFKGTRVTDTIYAPYYVSDCTNPATRSVMEYCKNYIKAVPAYCVASTSTSGGKVVSAPFSFKNASSNGVLTRAVLAFFTDLPETYHFGPATEATLFYTHDEIWPVNGTLTEGYPDRTTKFYDSILYRGIILGNLTGFTDVYTDPTGSVKVFELTD